jgi:PP-loop superfamily ATP-utilizing enzyme
MNASKLGMSPKPGVHAVEEGGASTIRVCELWKVYHDVINSVTVEELATRACVSIRQAVKKACEKQRDRRQEGTDGKRVQRVNAQREMVRTLRII